MSGRKSTPGADPGRAYGLPRARPAPALRWPLLLLACIVAAQGASAGQRYLLNQTFGTIAFSVGHLGLFSSHGEFRRFNAHLLLDERHPERSEIAVTVDARSVDMGWQDGTDMLRSPDFLDVQHHPSVRFTSTSVQGVSPGHYLIHGVIRIRGVAQPMLLSATLTGRHDDPARHVAWVDFVVSGSLKRSAFGMTADQTFIADRVNLLIKARLELGDAPHAG